MVSFEWKTASTFHQGTSDEVGDLAALWLLGIFLSYPGTSQVFRFVNKEALRCTDTGVGVLRCEDEVCGNEIWTKFQYGAQAAVRLDASLVLIHAQISRHPGIHNGESEHH